MSSRKQRLNKPDRIRMKFGQLLRVSGANRKLETATGKQAVVARAIHLMVPGRWPHQIFNREDIHLALRYILVDWNDNRISNLISKMIDDWEMFEEYVLPRGNTHSWNEHAKTVR